MPFIHSNKTNLYFQQRGATNAFPIVLGHGLLYNHHIFDQTIQVLAKDYQCTAYDLRGHGKSAMARGDMQLETLVQDTTVLLEQSIARSCHFVGHGISAFIGLAIAQQRPDLIQSLTLLDPIPPSQSKDKFLYKMCLWALKYVATHHIAHTILKTHFSDRFIENTPQTFHYWQKQLSNNSKKTLRTTINALAYQTSPTTIAIPCPTHILYTGTYLPFTYTAHRKVKSQQLHNIGHLCTIEAPHLIAQQVHKQLTTSNLTHQNTTY